jgi:phosphatidylinositol alpha-1,6-mannosyltransferase
VLFRVVLWPHSRDIIEYYSAADLVIAPSREDAFNMPALEALACRLPLIVSSRAGVAELLEDGRHAWVLQSPEDPAELTGLIRRVIREPELALRVAREGRALAESLPWRWYAEDAAALIEREARTPRVLVLATDAWGTGGIERATRSLLRALGDLYGPERVGLLSVRGGRARLSCRVLWRGPTGGAGQVGRILKARYAVAAVSAARRWRNNLVIVTCHPHLAPVARACQTASGAPFVVWCHGVEVWGRLRPALRAALHSANLLVAPSKFTATRVETTAGLSRGSVQVLPHGLSPEIVPSSEACRARAPRALSVARLSPEHAYKGLDTLLTAWTDVRRAVPGAELLVVGDGPDRSRLQAEAASMGLDGSVKFAGCIDDRALARAYAESAVFALPVRTRIEPRPQGEGFGLTLLESAAAGLPVVAGRGGAIPEVVKHGVTGLLVDPDDPRDVSHAIIRLLQDPELAARMGEAGRSLARERFSFERFREDVRVLIENQLRRA